jgi:hypothetical protein
VPRQPRLHLYLLVSSSVLRLLSLTLARPRTRSSAA